MSVVVIVRRTTEIGLKFIVIYYIIFVFKYRDAIKYTLKYTLFALVVVILCV